LVSLTTLADLLAIIVVKNQTTYRHKIRNKGGFFSQNIGSRRFPTDKVCSEDTDDEDDNIGD